MDKACKEPRHSWRDQNRNSIEKKEKKDKGTLDVDRG